MSLVHDPWTATSTCLSELFAGAWRPACGVRSAEISDDVANVTCQRCLASRWGPNGADVVERQERQWDRARARARDRREAERAVLARHADELEVEVAMRALARIGS